jgi:cysteine desulfurase/selenocysteine lyase
MSNVTGTVTPMKEIVARAHARGIPVVADGSQGAVHLDVDVQDLDVDFYIFTGHKVYGPTGIGVLYGKKEWLEQMPPFNGGGEMIGEVTEDRITYAAPPHRFEAGTPPIVQAIGLGAALEYMMALGRQNIRAHEEKLLHYAQERLSKLNSIRIFGEAPGKGGIVSFELKNAHAHDVATVLDRHGIAVRAGTHCAQPLLARYGVTSTCRASFGLYNTLDEVDALVEALIKAQTFFS